MVQPGLLLSARLQSTAVGEGSEGDRVEEGTTQLVEVAVPSSAGDSHEDPGYCHRNCIVSYISHSKFDSI